MHVFDLLDPAASVTVAALTNGLWQGLVLLGLVWGLLRIAEARRRQGNSGAASAAESQAARLSN